MDDVQMQDGEWSKAQLLRAHAELLHLELETCRSPPEMVRGWKGEEGRESPVSSHRGPTKFALLSLMLDCSDEVVARSTPTDKVFSTPSTPLKLDLTYFTSGSYIVAMDFFFLSLH